jgi:hypothetical protein
MPAVTYARPRLTTTADKRYRAHVQQFVLQRKNQRAMRPPLQRELFGGQAETALRDWLATQHTLSERRILEYEERRGKRAITKYRELDAISLEIPRSAWVFEIKASRAAGSLHHAIAQLHETRAILRLLYSTVYTTILLVDTGIPTADEVAELMASEEAPQKPSETLAEALDKRAATVGVAASLAECGKEREKTDVLLFGVDDIIALVGAENLALDWEADEAVELAPPPPPEAGPVYSSDDDESDDDDDDNPMAQALRRAGLGQ